ncbi:hypothetical protein L596_027510 [Steinernema carpocapsae]|uniref:Uncharacterized protein n=1 Tax=Steinernema carpocapsae TaxID=34508 RepID=A0A4U5LVQ6_STECR|nr:hypothetical protein L596_027510 [Steinernema carpocapsae]
MKHSKLVILRASWLKEPRTEVPGPRMSLETQDLSYSQNRDFRQPTDHSRITRLELKALGVSETLPEIKTKRT